MTPEGPWRLAVSWSDGWERVVVTLDGKEVGVLQGGLDALGRGAKLRLPDGERLELEVERQRYVFGERREPRLYVDAQPLFSSKAKSLPLWSYLCMAFSLPILFALGLGLLQLGVVLGSWVVCAVAPRDLTRSLDNRVLRCLGAVLLAWILAATYVDKPTPGGDLGTPSPSASADAP